MLNSVLNSGVWVYLCINLKLNKMKLPIGTKVYDARFGWGNVELTDGSTDYNTLILFETGHKIWFSETGVDIDMDVKMETLSLTEYNFVTGGFTPISEYRETHPRKDDIEEFMTEMAKLLSKLLGAEISVIKHRD